MFRIFLFHITSSGPGQRNFISLAPPSPILLIFILSLNSEFLPFFMHFFSGSESSKIFLKCWWRRGQIDARKHKQKGTLLSETDIHYITVTPRFSNHAYESMVLLIKRTFNSKHFRYLTNLCNIRLQSMFHNRLHTYFFTDKWENFNNFRSFNERFTNTRSRNKMDGIRLLLIVLYHRAKTCVSLWILKI